jgi:HEAT repeat protein
MLKVNYKIVLTVALGLIFTASFAAQPKGKVTAAFVNNLVAGLHSDNYGLRRNCIYYIGEYKIKEAAKDLIQAYKKEESAANKILIVYSLYRIGDVKIFEELAGIIENEKDQKVKITCGSVVEQFNEDAMMGLK